MTGNQNFIGCVPRQIDLTVGQMTILQGSIDTDLVLVSGELKELFVT
jgi:hypothetical protein